MPLRLGVPLSKTLGTKDHIRLGSELEEPGVRFCQIVHSGTQVNTCLLAGEELAVRSGHSLRQDINQSSRRWS